MKPYNEGWRARERNQPKETNPYDQQAAKGCWDSWNEGWDDADSNSGWTP